MNIVKWVREGIGTDLCVILSYGFVFGRILALELVGCVDA